MYQYDENFYRYINQGALESARVLVAALVEALPIEVGSVLDAGCGAGAWLSVWKSRGAAVVGLDGDYVSGEQLLIEPGEFRAVDLAAGFDLGASFDLVQSLEVAEHLPEASAARFVESLCRHADIVLFSAAPPGQGGENHVNEQPYDYWRERFRRQGFALYDPLRGAVAGNTAVKPWYRYNTLLYVRENARPEVHAALAASRVGPDGPVPDLSPAWYRLRKRVVRLLPPATATRVAILKKKLFGLSLPLEQSRG